MDPNYAFGALSFGGWAWDAPTFVGDYGNFGDYSWGEVTWGGWQALSAKTRLRASTTRTPTNVVNDISYGTVTDGAITDGAITDGAITDGAITDGAITDGAIDYEAA